MNYTGIEQGWVFPERSLNQIQERTEALGLALGRTPKILIGKPGLDGHSNGAEQIAVAARDAGFDALYEGIRLTSKHIVRSAVDEGVHVVGLSILSGSHMSYVPEIVAGLRAEGSTVPVVLGGIIPEADHPALLEAGVAAIYTPKDYEITRHIIPDILDLIEQHHKIDTLAYGYRSWEQPG